MLYNIIIIIPSPHDFSFLPALLSHFLRLLTLSEQRSSLNVRDLYLDTAFCFNSLVVFHRLAVTCLCVCAVPFMTFPLCVRVVLCLIDCVVERSSFLFSPLTCQHPACFIADFRNECTFDLVLAFPSTTLRHLSSAVRRLEIDSSLSFFFFFFSSLPPSLRLLSAGPSTSCCPDTPS